MHASDVSYFHCLSVPKSALFHARRITSTSVLLSVSDEREGTLCSLTRRRKAKLDNVPWDWGSGRAGDRLGTPLALPTDRAALSCAGWRMWHHSQWAVLPLHLLVTALAGLSCPSHGQIGPSCTLSYFGALTCPQFTSVTTLLQNTEDWLLICSFCVRIRGISP